MASMADRFAGFKVASVEHGGPVARGTVRRYLAEHAEAITEDEVRFKDGSSILRAAVTLPQRELEATRAAIVSRR
jgi:hypothetical protein